MKKLYIKKAFIFTFVLSLVILNYPSKTEAVGKNYLLYPYNHWGSDACTTGYPYLVFTVDQNRGESFVQIQKLTSGNWVNLYSVATTMYGDVSKDFKVAAWSSSTQYRVYIESGPLGGPTISGRTDCRGSW